MAKKGKTASLHLMHASMAFDLSSAGFEGQLTRMLTDMKPDILTTTESRNFASIFRRVCRAHGYTPVEHKYKSCLMAVNTSREKLYVKNSGMVFILSGAAGLYPDKTLNWVVVQFHGVRIFHHVAHWVPPHAAGYVANHKKMTNALVTQVRLHAKKKNVSFFAGDINVDDEKGKKSATGWNQTMRENRLQTIWDEFGVYPPTMGGRSKTIDVIGKYLNDNIKGTRHKVWPKMQSDHRAVSAWYEIDIDKETKDQGGNNNGGGGGGGNQPDDPADPGNNGGGGGGEDDPTDSDHSGDPADDDFYATGGNVSWADYLDDTIFNLPQATDDSDTANG